MKTLDKEVNASKDSKDEDDPLTSSSSSSTTIISKSKSRQTQPTLQSVIKKKEMWSLDDSRSINITKKIGEMIALDAEAFALVERKGFERLIKFLAPQYPLPCRTYFSEKIIPQLYENLKTRIRIELITARYISFSTDIWTCSANNEAFISLTAHFIRNDDIRRQIYVLSAKHFPGSHTGVNIGQILNDIMEEWHINSNQIHLILRDNAANMIVGTERDIPTLTAMQWNMVENVIRVLQPFEEITKILSSDCETIEYVIPAVVTLHSYLSKRQKDTGIVMLKKELKKAIEERFFNSIGFNIKDRKCFVLATMLDPRFKTKFLSDENKAKQWIIDELLEINNTITKDDENIENNTQNHVSPLQKQDIISETHDDIWKCFDDIINNSKSDTDNSSFEDSSSSTTFKRQPSDRSKKKAAVYNAELSKYLMLPLSPRNEDPLTWWKTHILEYPNLKTLVLKYLSAPPSSVHSERLFSAGKLVYSDNRNRLSPKNADILLFIMKNLLILNFDI
ncbi:PREDICTED: zinc finger BED domain-containing protein 1-like [Wasmannia auropunctata]|uniref:zinc finger BED domain-containing protein 1-like n=1 Tax=Wasmannia auropunctata TaxID=64793 RepID=UPI0005EF66A4|nr:PREDICTED: zinc finger BED domain-containing protein 1-like [Wasmannia auropunctata]